MGGAEFRRTSRFVRWDDEKNIWLKKERGVGFEEIVAAIDSGNLLADLRHHKEDRYPDQRIFIVSLNHYVYVVPYVEENNVCFLKTLYPDRNMTRKYLQESEQ